MAEAPAKFCPNCVKPFDAKWTVCPDCEAVPELTNGELQGALRAIAFDSTSKGRRDVCYGAAERIRELTEALKALAPEGWTDNDTMDHMPGMKLARVVLAKAGDQT